MQMMKIIFQLKQHKFSDESLKIKTKRRKNAVRTERKIYDKTKNYNGRINAKIERNSK